MYASDAAKTPYFIRFKILPPNITHRDCNEGIFLLLFSDPAMKNFCFYLLRDKNFFVRTIDTRYYSRVFSRCKLSILVIKLAQAGA